MKKCTQCGEVQDDGKFCGHCGGPLEEVENKVELTEEKQNNLEDEVSDDLYGTPDVKQEDSISSFDEEAATTTINDTSSLNQEQVSGGNQNETLDRLKDESKEYWSYFTYYLKQPSQIFTNYESEFKNGMINLIIMVITLAFSTYFLFRNFIVSAGMGYIDSVPFFPIFGNTLLYIVLFIALVIAILFVVNKLFSSDYSFKSIVSIFNGHLSLAVVISVAALLLLLIKANFIGMILITLVIGLALTSMPVYVISSLLTKKSKAIDPFYGYLIYVVAIAIGGIIIFTILADSTIGGFIDDLQYMF